MVDDERIDMLSEQQPCLICVTQDMQLSHLIALEAAELSLPATIAPSLPQSTDRTPYSIVLLDLDSPGGIQAALHGRSSGFVGICHDTAVLPSVLTERVRQIWERPIATSQLRALLRQMCGESAPINRSGSFQNHSSTSEWSLVMQDDTTLLQGGCAVRLTPKEAAIMRLLLANRGKVVSHQALEQCLQASCKSGAKGNKIEVYLCYLRRKLECPSGMRLITNVRGVGYRLEWGTAQQK